MNRLELMEAAKQSGLYQASPTGLVWTCRIPRMKKQTFRDRWIVAGNLTGAYWSFKFKGVNLYVHRFVWHWFNGPIPDGWEVDHLDNDPLNNTLVNLEPVSRSENQRRRWARRPEMRQQHSLTFMGRTFSDETRLKMSESAQRRQHA